MRSSIVINNELIVNLVRKKIKNINLSISRDGAVKVSAPLRVPVSSIEKFVLSKKAWINKHLDKFQNKPLSAEREYIDGEVHYYLGRAYALRINSTDNIDSLSRVVPGSISTAINGSSQYLDIYKSTSNISTKYVLNTWYRAQLANIADELLSKWQEVIGVSICGYNIKQMKSRWGSCHPIKRHITLNFELIKVPLECLEYVVVHELVHILEASHNHRFKAFMDQFLPDWRTIKKQLNNFHLTLI